MAIYIFLIFRYFLIDKHKFRAKIFESLKKSHSAYCKLERNDSSILNERLESYNNNNFINYNTKILTLKVSDEVNLNNMPYDYSLVNDNRNFISIFFSILKDTDFLFGIFFKKNKFKIFSLSIGIFIHHVNFMLILNSILIFDNIISYKFLFLTNEAVLIAIETRTSSPVRIVRDAATLQHVRLQGLFPCGEGAGYAGGIVSAAVDGERCAEMCAELFLGKSES